jgi:hypothetical protein
MINLDAESERTLNANRAANHPGSPLGFAKAEGVQTNLSL